MRITGRELAAARTLTGLNQKQFAKLAGINPDTLNRLEKSGPSRIKAKPATVEKLLTCFGQHGVALAPGRIIHAP
jgi:transcriptional regulator with XRE-family HTH domain